MVQGAANGLTGAGAASGARRLDVDTLAPVDDAETAGWPNIEFPQAAVVGVADRLIEEFYRLNGAEPAHLCIDFRSSTFIEIATLQLITSHILRRYRLGCATKLRLPAGDAGLNARHFLRRWSYADVFETLFRTKKFAHFVDRADRRYFAGSPTGGDPGDPYAGAVVRHSTREGEISYRKEAYRFFGFRTWLLSDDMDKRQFVEQERKRWKDADPLIAETLNRRLKAPVTPDAAAEHSRVNSERLVVGRIVFQAITNALRHARASVLQASSHMVERIVIGGAVDKRAAKTDTFFTLVYWDDGESMYATLRRALEAGLPISHPTRMTAAYLIDARKPTEPDRKAHIISSTVVPTNASSDEELLISTIFPGITCDVKDAERLASLGLEEDDPRLAVPGHGLFVLIQTAVELFGGSVAFRTGNFFMNISGLTEKRWQQQRVEGPRPSYKIKINRSEPAFLGNMVTVRLPLSGPSQ